VIFNREGETVHVLANELVPGDIVTFSTGDRIPADIRIVNAVDLEIDESSLTGETEARRKTSQTCLFEGGREATGDPVALADRTCIAYMGTLVRNGQLTSFLSLHVTQGLDQVEELVLLSRLAQILSLVSSSP
jgi:Ca2+-transporting ATPase